MRYRLSARNPFDTGAGNLSRGAFGAYLSGAGDVTYTRGPFHMSGLGDPIYDTSGNIIGDTGTSSGGTDSSGVSTPGWLQNLVTGVTSYVTGKQQLDAIAQINQINIQRAAQGLPPIAVPQLGQPGVQVGISPQVQQLLIYGGLAVGALWIFSTVMRRV